MTYTRRTTRKQMRQAKLDAFNTNLRYLASIVNAPYASPEAIQLESEVIMLSHRLDS